MLSSADVAVGVVGETVRRELFAGAVGQTGQGLALRLKQRSCKVVGILTAKGQDTMGDQRGTATALAFKPRLATQCQPPSNRCGGSAGTSPTPLRGSRKRLGRKPAHP